MIYIWGYATLRKSSFWWYVKKCQFATVCWPFLPLNFCKLGLNDLKISERLLFYELCIISKNDENSRFFGLMAPLHSFGSNLAMSKDFGNCYMKNFDIAKNVKGERMQSVKNQALETHWYVICGGNRPPEKFCCNMIFVSIVSFFTFYFL